MSNVPPPPYGEQPPQQPPAGPPPGGAAPPPGGAPPPGFGQTPPPAYGQPTYGGGGGGGGGTNPLAIASLVVSILGLCCGIGSIVGIVLGFVARKQIADSGGTQGGDGLALAGIVIGFATLALSILLVIINGSVSFYTS